MKSSNAMTLAVMDAILAIALRSVKAPVSRRPELFRLLYAIAKIASITARIIALLDFAIIGTG